MSNNDQSQEDKSRADFEQWYVENIHDLKAEPLGSRTCGWMWKAWQAGRSEPLNALKEVPAVLRAARSDIHELLRVAKYNLRGEACGEILPGGPPETKLMVHESGISQSERVIERLLETLKKVEDVIVKAEGRNP